ncbi:protein FAM187B-like [Amblyraja radiata]|uniref:protein FAM187B-like n=1 Tax=Amblyraja radiata TaxID=386614 RepID=UPI00140247BF|nr:protein FAM187B-like [Amblyraja radiata]
MIRRILLLTLGTLALMGGLPNFMKQEDDLAYCLGTAPCSLAFLSNNPLSLRCPAATEALEDSVYWQYQDLSQPQTKPRTFIGPGHLRVYRGPMGKLGSRAKLRRGSLIMNKAETSDTGLYLCKSADSILAAYQVDVQDSSLLYVSHQGLGESTMSNWSLRVNLGSSQYMVRLYTRWGPWQDCDRCKVMGEQKMVGFCYAKLSEIDKDEEEDEELEVNGATLPCGLMELHIVQSLPRRGAELHYQMCREPCEKEEIPTEIVANLLPEIGDWWWSGRETAFNWMKPRMLLQTVYLDIHDNARMTCPGASVYTPVLWQRDSTFITRGGNCNGSHQLDDTTGGGIYQIESVKPSDRGIYRCWVHGHWVASFHLETPELPVVRRRVTWQLLNGMRILVGTIAMVFVISAVAETLYACLFEIF